MKKAWIVIAALVACAWAYLAAASDYRWANAVIRQNLQAGWVLVNTQAHYSALSRPWTIFKSPVSRLAFVRPHEIERLSESHVYGKILWVNHRELESTQTDIVGSVVDCTARKDAFVEPQVPPRAINLSSLSWRDTTPNSPGEEINRYLCSSAHN